MNTKVTHTRQPDTPQTPVNRVLATVAEALVAFGAPDQFGIMTAVVLAARQEITPDEAVEIAYHGTGGEIADKARDEAGRLLDIAKAVDE